MGRPFNEMFTTEGECRPGYELLDAWLTSANTGHLDRSRAEAELLFRRIGISFAVYGAASAEERIISFDIPRIVRRRERRRLVHHATPTVTPDTTTQVELTGARQLIELLKAQVDDLRGDRDGWRQQAEASQRLLTHVQQVPEPASRSWWKRLAG